MSYDYSKLREDKVAPHLAPVKFLLGLKFNKRRSIVPARTAMEMYDLMRLKPEHVDEVVEALIWVADLIKIRKERYSPLIGGYATRALNRLKKQSASAESVAVADIAAPGGSHEGSRQASFGEDRAPPLAGDAPPR